MADLMAREAIAGREVFARAVKDGNDLEARDGMALAATLGGLAFSNSGVALYSDGISGRRCRSRFSRAGNRLLLPSSCDSTSPNGAEEFSAIGRFLGLTDLSGDVNEDAAKTIRAIEQLRADIGIPLRLRDIGVKEEMLAGFATKAFAIKRLMQ